MYLNSFHINSVRNKNGEEVYGSLIRISEKTFVQFSFCYDYRIYREKEKAHVGKIKKMK